MIGNIIFNVTLVISNGVSFYYIKKLLFENALLKFYTFVVTKGLTSSISTVTYLYSFQRGNIGFAYAPHAVKVYAFSFSVCNRMTIS